MERYKAEVLDVEGAPECMRISGFMHGITHPGLIKRLYERIPRSMDEMYRMTTSFLQGEVAAPSHGQRKASSSWKQSEGGNKPNFKKGLKNKHRLDRKPDRFSLLTKTPKEIFALEKGKFKAPPQCTDECMQLRKQIDEMIKAGKLSQFIKELKQNDKPKAPKKGEASGKDKPLTILMIEPWERVAKPRITKSFSPETAISFPPLGEEDGTEGPMIIEAEMGGHFVHRIYVDDGASLEVLYEHCFIKLRKEIRDQMVPTTTHLIGFSGETIWPLGQIALLVKIGDVHSTSAWMNFMVIRSPSQHNAIIGRPGIRKIHAVPSTAHGMLKFPVEGGTKRDAKNYCSLLKQNLDIFSWKPADMTGVPRNIAEHRLNIQEGYSPAGKRKEDRHWKEIREGRQIPVYFVSRTPRGPEVNYTPMEKLVLALLSASKRLKRYSQAHTVVVITDQPIKQLLSSSEISGRMLKWKFELEGYDIQYRPRTAIKGQILADFIVERPEEESSDELMTEPEVLPEPSTLFTDGSSCVDGSGAGLILTNPLVAGIKLTLLHRQRVRHGFQYLTKKNTVKSFKEFSVKQIPRSENKKADALSKIASTSFTHLNKQVLVEELKEKPINEKEILDVVEEEGNTWMTPICEYLAKETFPEDKKEGQFSYRRKARQVCHINENPIQEVLFRTMAPVRRTTPSKLRHKRNTRGVVQHALRPKICGCQSNPNRILLANNAYGCTELDKEMQWLSNTPFGLPGEIISDNGKQFRDNPLKDWCEKLCIRHLRFVKHPQANGLLKAKYKFRRRDKGRLDEKKKRFVNRLGPHKERWEQACNTQKQKAEKDEKYYNSRVRGTSFKPGDMVYRSNEASHAKDEGKLGPKWEGPYEVTAGAVMLTDGVYWLVIFPFLTIVDYEMGFRFPWFRISYFILFTAIYVIFEWIVHAFVDTWWPYPFLNVSAPTAPMWYWVVAVLHLPCYAMFGLLVKTKYYILTRWFPESYQYGSGAGLILTNPEGAEFTYAMRFRFEATNNEAEYEALIASLRIAEQMGVKNLQANVDSRLVANQVNGSCIAKESGMVQYLDKVKTLAKSFKEFSIKQIPRSENKKADALSKITSTSFTHLSKQVLVEELKEKSINEKEILDVVEEEGNTWMTPIYEYLGIDIAGPFPEGPGKVKFLIVAIDYFTKWIEAKAVATIIGNQVKKFIWDNIVCRFGLPGEIISDNRKQFRDNPFKDWCEKLCIRQCFASVKHPQANGLVERANKSLGEGIKARLDERSKDWIEELPHVLWAHRIMIKSSNSETPFSLTYGTKAVIPAEIGMPTLRTTEIDLTKNNEALEINLDLIEERREQAAIQEAKSKKKIEKYYNSRVRGTSFKPGDMVYHSNKASHARDEGKLRPKWEGPYKVKESLGKGAYKLKDFKRNEMPRTWNIYNLKKCYIHEV
ncbi:reverse transcriptase domain-containing protein [Tanacetum coccineum]